MKSKPSPTLEEKLVWDFETEFGMCFQPFGENLDKAKAYLRKVYSLSYQQGYKEGKKKERKRIKEWAEGWYNSRVNKKSHKACETCYILNELISIVIPEAKV